MSRQGDRAWELRCHLGPADAGAGLFPVDHVKAVTLVQINNEAMKIRSKSPNRSVAAAAGL